MRKKSLKLPLTNIYSYLGLDNLSEQDKLNLSNDLGEVALARIATRLEAILTPAQMVEFETRLQIDEAQAYELLERFVPYLNSVVEEEIAFLSHNIISTHDAVMKKLGL